MKKGLMKRRWSVILSGAFVMTNVMGMSANSQQMYQPEKVIARVEFSQIIDFISLEELQEMLQVNYSGDPNDPGFLWKVAIRLQKELTDEQKDRLSERHFERLSEQLSGRLAEQFSEQLGRHAPLGCMRQNSTRHGRRFSQRGTAGARRAPLDSFRGRPGGQRFKMGARGLQPGNGGMLLGQLNLAAEQREQVREIHESYRDEHEAIANALREGELTNEEARNKLEAVRHAVQSDVETILTDEQKEKTANLKTDQDIRRASQKAVQETAKEAGRANMVEALNLSDEQTDALNALHEEGTAMRADLARQLQSSADRAQTQEALKQMHEGHRTELKNILNETQFEIFMIHQVLVQHRRPGQTNQRAGFRQPNMRQHFERGFGEFGRRQMRSRR